ncbi:MAG: hypothetical protein MI921_01105 [Cytophagales bacterium]|nr:hypothetical protein [Cytophagales bacterium]
MKERTTNTRSAFLKNPAISTAGVGLATSFTAKSYASIPGANDRINVGIVGFSNRAKNSLIPAFHIHNKELNFRITSVSDIWNRRHDECVAYMKTKFDNKKVTPYRNNEALYIRVKRSHLTTLIRK